MENSLFVTIVSVFNAFCTIFTAFYTIVSLYVKHYKKARSTQHPQLRKLFYAIILVMICFSILSSFYLLIDSNDSSRIIRLLWGLSLIIGIGLLLWYVHNAIKSLDREQENIWPPRLLWQMLLNKVPSMIPDVENNSKDVMLAVVSMDDSDSVLAAENEINKKYHEGKDYIKVNGYIKNKNKKEIKYSLSELNKKEGVRGVLFLVGPSAAYKMKDLKETIAEYADSHKVNPIACYWSVEGKEYTFPYYHMKYENLGGFVERLATRGYYRNYMQIRLGHAYQKAFIILGLLLLVLLIGLISFSPKIKGLWTENSVQQLKICELRDSITELRDSVSFYLRPENLDNNIDVALRNKEVTHLDDSIKDAISEFSMYYFQDLKGLKGVRLWYDDDSLVCIIDTYKNRNGIIKKEIRNDYLLDAVLKHQIFVFWPSENNIKSNVDSTVIVWRSYRDDTNHSNDVKGVIKKDNQNYCWTGNINGNDTLRWYSNSDSDKEKCIFLFSYDGKLAVEIDVDHKSFNDNYNYMSHLMFRNSVRKYMNIVTHVLNMKTVTSSKKTEDGKTKN